MYFSVIRLYWLHNRIFLRKEVLFFSNAKEKNPNYLFKSLQLRPVITQGKTRYSSDKMTTLTRAGLGGVNISPLLYFLDSWKTTADIDAKLLVLYSASIWHLLTKYQKKTLRSFWENCVLVTSCSAILGQKAANVCRLQQCAGLK